LGGKNDAPSAHRTALIFILASKAASPSAQRRDCEVVRPVRADASAPLVDKEGLGEFALLARRGNSDTSPYPTEHDF
jgi:hypothetical protein